jgi:DNA-binding GntR family transcriptional regulator
MIGRPVEPLDRRTTVYALIEEIRGRILSGDLSGGMRLPERELTERYDVSRHSLRVAFRALAEQGLVHLEMHRSATVAMLTRDEIRDVLVVRAALEVEGARLALQYNAGRLPVRDELAALKAVCSSAETPFSEVVIAHTAFHRGIVACGNSVHLIEAYDRLAAKVHLFLVQAQPRWPREHVAAEHAALVAEIETDGPGALRSHLLEASEGLVDDLRDPQ